MRLRRSAGVLAVTLVVGVLSPDARASVTVELTVARTPVRIGERAVLRGAIAPASAGDRVRVEDAEGVVVATATTGPHGGFEAAFVPRRNVNVRARLGGAVSPWVAVDVRARVLVNLWQARLFDRVVVTGHTRPPIAGAHVVVRLVHAGREVARRWPRVHADGTFRTDLTVARPGWYRATARFAPRGLWPASGGSRARRTSLPALSRGDSGVYVGLLERRLVSLGYRLDGAGGRFDARTGDAVVAFHKVQRMTRRFDVTTATWRALARPMRPHARFRWPAFHLEIDQTRQVLITVRDGAVTSISHVSTGKASTPTYDGGFRVYRKVGGTYNGLYYPSYFDGGRAIHGWKDVPTYPASHGCIRFPFWNAVWIFRHAPMGVAVQIYH